MRVGITGGTGMLGWQLRCHLRQFDGPEPGVADRHSFSDPEALRRFAAGCDVLVHLAALNRGSSEDVAEINPRLARSLVDALRSSGARPHVIYSSSIHVDRDTPYGRAKRAAGEIIAGWAEEAGAGFTNLVLPHVFGEGARPFHNSVVATFAYQLANDQKPKLMEDGELELMHARDVCREIWRIAGSGETGELRPGGSRIRVSGVLSRLEHIADSYRSDVVPDLRDPLNRRLFNLYRFFLFPAYYPRRLEARSDERGRLFEAIKNLNGGQTFFSTTRPGVTRGDHYHYEKVERFLVVQGEARIRVRRLYDDAVRVFDVSGDRPAFVDMPVLHTHNITNVGRTDLTTLFWSNEIFDPARPDTVSCAVEPQRERQSGSLNQS